ncbi:MAG: type IV pilus assembly protein PilM [Armatimonadota bacterium]
MAIARASVGVDIGHSAIKVVQVDKSGAGWKIVKVGTALTPPDVMRDGNVTNPDELGAAIKLAMKEGHIHSGHAVIAAAGGATFVRTVPFPKMSPNMLRDSVKFEAGRYVPGSIEESYVEAEIVGPLSETQMNVLLASAPKDLVGGRIAACKEAGLHVDIVDLETFAAYRTLVETDPSRRAGEESYMFLNIGGTSTSVTVIDKGVFVMNRTMPSGGNTLTEALKQAFKLETVDAEAGKTVLDMRELLAGSVVENPPLKVMASQVDDLVREIRRSLNYLQTQNQQAEGTPPVEIKEIILTGGGAKLRGLDAYLSAKLGLNVHALGAFDNRNIISLTGTEDSGLDLTIAVGLAIRGQLKAA